MSTSTLTASGPDGFDKRRMANQLVDILNNATDQDWEEGTYWYASAHSFAAALAIQHGVTLETAAGVVAALSPQLPWSRNEIVAVQLFETGDCVGALGANKAKARRILAGEPVDQVLACATCSRGDTRKHECSGQKVRAFYASIVNPVGPAVCVDRHALDAALAHKGTEGSRKVLDRVGVYAMVAGAYRAAARRVGLAPAQAQAIVWVAWRRQHAWRTV